MQSHIRREHASLPVTVPPALLAERLASFTKLRVTAATRESNGLIQMFVYLFICWLQQPQNSHLPRHSISDIHLSKHGAQRPQKPFIFFL